MKRENHPEITNIISIEELLRSFIEFKGKLSLFDVDSEFYCYSGYFISNETGIRRDEFWFFSPETDEKKEFYSVIRREDIRRAMKCCDVIVGDLPGQSCFVDCGGI